MRRAKERRKVTRKATRKARRKNQKGGAPVDIRQKPIVVLFSHGGCEINKICESSGVYKLDKNVQLMTLAHPGESLTISDRFKSIIEDKNFRYTTFEPIFDMHSISDLNKKNASYITLGEHGAESPFTNEGRSIFESPLRGKEGSIVPNTLLTFERIGMSSTLQSYPKFGIYVYFPEKSSPILHIPVGDIQKKENFLHLSDIFDFLKHKRIYEPEVGLGVIQVSCNTFYKEYKEPHKIFIAKGNIVRNKEIEEKCYAIEYIYQKSNTEYNELDLLGSQGLKSKYDKILVPIISPIRARREPTEVIEMMERV